MEPFCFGAEGRGCVSEPVDAQSRASVRHFADPPDFINSSRGTGCGRYPRLSSQVIVSGQPSGSTTCFPTQTALQANLSASCSVTGSLDTVGMRSAMAACAYRSNAAG